MQPQSGTSSSPYYNQYYQPTTATDLPPFNPVSTASAPPVMASQHDYSYPSDYSSFPSNPDHIPNHTQYSFPHQDTSQNHQFYNQKQPPVDYDYDQRNHNPEPAYDPYSLNSYTYGSSDVPYHANSYESNLNYGGDQRISDDGVYKYNGVPVEPSYGGKGGRSSDAAGGDGGVLFDDYGRPITVPGGKVQNEFGNSSPRIVKAVPKMEESEDVKGGVQKFRVKQLSEGYGQTDMDVLCQVGKI